jgi:DNA repair photolyase
MPSPIIIKEINAKNIITPSKIPGCDFTLNPYVGCCHACVYCYAGFMQRVTKHAEAWGDFIDVKMNAGDLIYRDGDGAGLAAARAKYDGKTITMGSVTDVYQAVEGKYKLTRQILERLQRLDVELFVITKSNLVTRDIDLLLQQKNCTVAISLSQLDEALCRRLEPRAPSVVSRLAALRKLHEAGVRTVLFISPIFPRLTPWAELVAETVAVVDEYWFENLNLYPTTKQGIKAVLDSIDGRLWWDEYLGKYYGRDGERFWREEEQRIATYCKQRGIAHRIFFRH